MRPHRDGPRLAVGPADPADARLAGAILILALILRCVGLWRRGLWTDELLSATYSSHGLIETVLTVLRFDVHPPLYYLQLSLWMLAGSHPLWLMANSILWSLAAVAGLMLAAGRLFGPRCGLIAGALLAVSPAALAYSDQVRMYAFISALMIWVWWAQVQWSERRTWRTSLALVLSQVCVVYAHSAGVFIIAGAVLFGAATVAARRDRRALLSWIGLEALVAVLALPVLLIGSLHTVTHPLRPDLLDGAKTWLFLGAGDAIADGPHVVVAVGVALVLIAGLIWAPRLRLPILTLVCAPLLVAAAVSYAVKPIWIDRIFAPITPFIALMLARIACEPDLAPAAARALGSTGARAAAVAALGLAWLAIGVADQATRSKTDGNAAAAAYVRAHARPGDQVVLYKELELWTFMAALQGPNWGDPLHAHPPNPVWDRLMSRLPPVIVRAYRPGALTWWFHGVEIRLTDPAAPPADPPGDLIAVSTAPYPVKGRILIQRLSLPPFFVERWRRDEAASPPPLAPR